MCPEFWIYTKFDWIEWVQGAMHLCFVFIFIFNAFRNMQKKTSLSKWHLIRIRVCSLSKLQSTEFHQHSGQFISSSISSLNVIIIKSIDSVLHFSVMCTHCLLFSATEVHSCSLLSSQFSFMKTFWTQIHMLSNLQENNTTSENGLVERKQLIKYILDFTIWCSRNLVQCV